MTHTTEQVFELKRYGSTVLRADLYNLLNLETRRQVNNQLEFWQSHGRAELVDKFLQYKGKHFLPRELVVEFIEAIEGVGVRVVFV